MSEPKKRKRDSEEDSGSDLDAASSQPVKVKIVEDDEWCPILASSPGLAFPEDISLQTYKKKTGGSIFSDPRIAPPGYKPETVGYEYLLHSSAHPTLDFIGKEESKYASNDDNAVKHYAAIYDPETSALEIMPSRKVLVRFVPRTEAEEMRAQAEEAAKQRATIATQRNELGLEFGSKRAKKAIAASAQNAIAPARAASSGPEKLDAVGSALLSDAAASTKDRPTQASLQAAADKAKPRPQANLEAKTPAEVYPVGSIVGADVMKALAIQDWLDLAEKGKDVQTHSRYVAHRLHGIATGPQKNVQKLKLLRYITVLIDFVGCLKPGQRGTKALPKLSELKGKLKASETVVGHVEKTFSDGGNVGKWHTDFLRTTVCALALIVDNLQVSTTDLKHDLKTDDNAIAQYFRELGCQVRSLNEGERIKMKISKAASTGTKMATLKLPLDFPVQRVRKRKGQ